MPTATRGPANAALPTRNKSASNLVFIDLSSSRAFLKAFGGPNGISREIMRLRAIVARCSMADFHHLVSFEPGRPGAEESALPAVSIITSQTAAGQLFVATATALFAQSLQNWEWIVQEGCIASADQRVRVRPVPSVESARARFILFLHPGDLLEPTTLEKLWWLLEAHPELPSASVRSGGKPFVMLRRGAAPRLGPPCNPIQKPEGKRRLLLLAPHLEIGGADNFNLDLIECLQREHAYEVS